MTIKEFATKNELRLELTKIPFRTDVVASEWDKEAKHFAYRLYVAMGDNFGKEMKGLYSQGSGIKRSPEIDDILNALLCDIQGIGDYSFEDWAGNIGYDIDSRKAEGIYNACLKENKDIRNLLGNAYNKFLELETL